MATNALNRILATRHPALLDFSLPELRAMWHAGEARRIVVAGVEHFVPVDVALTREDRFAFVRPHASTQRIFSLSTARWLHVGGRAPVIFEATIATGRPPRDARIAHRRMQLSAGDWHVIDGVLVTTAHRTANDLQRWKRREEAARFVAQLQMVG